MLCREPTSVPFSTEAMRASLLRLQKEWETINPPTRGMRFMAI